MAGTVIVLSAFAHGGLGWPDIARQLAATGAPPDLQIGLKIGWLFGSASMVVFGALGVHAALAQGGAGLGGVAPGLIAAAYLAFGLWAFVVSADPFFAVFIVPGGGLLLAWALARRAPGTTR